jgi:hypothetical protein
MQIAVPAAAAAVLLVKHLRNGSERRKRLETALDEVRFRRQCTLRRLLLLTTVSSGFALPLPACACSSGRYST